MITYSQYYGITLAGKGRGYLFTVDGEPLHFTADYDIARAIDRKLFELGRKYTVANPRIHPDIDVDGIR